MATIDNLEKLLASGQDSAMLRFGLARAYLDREQAGPACEHLARAIALDPDYSAAWKLYGKALAAAGRSAEAVEAYRQGIAIAEQRGDIQAAKEMGVFLRRLLRD